MEESKQKEQAGRKTGRQPGKIKEQKGYSRQESRNQAGQHGGHVSRVKASRSMEAVAVRNSF